MSYAAEGVWAEGFGPLAGASSGGGSYAADGVWADGFGPLAAVPEGDDAYAADGVWADGYGPGDPGSPFIPAKRGVGKRNYLIQGKKFYLADWELRLLIEQLTPKRAEVQIVNKDDVKQISRNLWKRLRDTDSALDALTFKQVDSVVQEATIEYDEDDDLVMLLL
jgi:hypothetical protein